MDNTDTTFLHFMVSLNPADYREDWSVAMLWYCYYVWTQTLEEPLACPSNVKRILRKQIPSESRRPLMTQITCV